jgi:hypothetical protein
VALPQFVTPNPNSDPTFNDPKYVFFGNSLFSPPPPGTFGSASNPGTGFNTRFVGGDATLSGNDVTVTTNNHLTDLLVNSTVSTTTNPGGDRYIITLDLSSSQFFHGNGVLIPNSSITVNPGSIIVTTAVAVPEPASLVSGLGAALLLTAWWRCSRRRVRRVDRES